MAVTGHYERPTILIHNAVIQFYCSKSDDLSDEHLSLIAIRGKSKFAVVVSYASPVLFECFLLIDKVRHFEFDLARCDLQFEQRCSARYLATPVRIAERALLSSILPFLLHPSAYISKL